MSNNPRAFVDITDVVCPVTFVKVKVALEELESGDELEVRLNGGEPIQNVPRSLKDEGHRVADAFSNDDGTWNLVVVKDGLSK
jgi:TusA-related sulfurtransferase